MTYRAKQVLLGTLFWLAFGPAAVCLILGLPIGILLYGLGNDNIRAWVYRSGKALDALCNAGFFGGLPQETISSHTGRYIQSVKPVPWKFKFVNWLTSKFEENHAVKAIETPFNGQDL